MIALDSISCCASARFCFFLVVVVVVFNQFTKLNQSLAIGFYKFTVCWCWAKLVNGSQATFYIQEKGMYFSCFSICCSVLKQFFISFLLVRLLASSFHRTSVSSCLRVVQMHEPRFQINFLVLERMHAKCCIQVPEGKVEQGCCVIFGLNHFFSFWLSVQVDFIVRTTCYDYRKKGKK